MSNTVVELNSVCLEIKNEPILKDVSLSLKKGEIAAIIGKNGSGKSMLFKALVGFFIPQKGTILINGENVLENNKFPSNIGALIEEPGFLPSYTGYENLELLASIQKKIGPDEIKGVLKEVGLEDAMHKKVKAYSMGMKQRLGIAQAYMEDPDIIVLDEPTNSLDEQGIKEIRNLVLELSKRGKTIIIATHDLEDFEALTPNVYKMERGVLKDIEVN